MTTAIEVTKREMYAKWNKAMEWVSPHSSESCHLDEFEELLEAHLETLRQDRANLVTERDALRNRVQVLEMANATSGEVILGLKEEARQARKNFMAARLAEVAASVSVPPYNASGAALDGNTATILGALVDAQRIMTAYLVPDGIRAKDAMGKLVAVLDNEKLTLAMRAFEQPKAEISGKSLEALYFKNRTMASVAIDKMVKNLMANNSSVEILSQPRCQHSFHPAFPSGELCTFCGVGK